MRAGEDDPIGAARIQNVHTYGAQMAEQMAPRMAVA